MPTFREDAKIGAKVPMMKTDDYNDQSVTKDKIRDGNITSEKLADGAVSTDKLPDGAIKTPKIADENITTSKLAEASVVTSKIADQNVTKEKIADQSVDNSKLSPEAVTYDKVKDKAIITEKLNDRAVTTEKVEEKAITNAKIGDSAVDGRTIGEASVEKKHLANDSVATEKLQDSSVTSDKIHTNAVTEEKIEDSAISNPKLADNSVGTSKIKDGNVTNEKVASNTLTIDKFDPELRKSIQAATGLPENLVEVIQDVDVEVKSLHSKDEDLQSQITDKQQQITANDKDIETLQNRSTQMEQSINNIAVTGGASVANTVAYSNTASGLVSINAQGAIDELAAKNTTKAEKAEVTAELEKKFDKESILQESGTAKDKVMSQKAVSDKLSDLSSKTFGVFNFTPDCAVNQKGELIANNKYCITRKIDVSNLVGKSIIWACGSNKQDLVVASLAFYDSSDAFLGYYAMSSTRTITVEENTSYIIATMDKENIDKSYIADVYGNILWSPFGNKVSDDGANKMLKYTSHLKIVDGGGVEFSEDTCITDKIDVSKYKGYDVIVNSQIGRERQTFASFYSDDGSCISSYLNDNTRSISVPSNASYLICTVSLDKVNSCYVERDKNNVLWRPTYDGMALEQKVDKTSIVQKLGEDESKVVSQKCVKSAFGVFNFTPDCAVNQKGELIANNKYCITRKIDVSNLVGKSIIWACGSNKQDLVVASLAFYDSSDAFLGYYAMSSTRTITVEENTSYIIATMDKENIDKSYIADVYGNILWSPFGNKVSDDGILPSYYNTYMSDKLEKINQLSLISSRRCDDFIFITDMHIEVNYMQSPKLIKHIVSRTNLKKLFNGGDVMNGQATREEGRIQLRRWMDLMSFIDQYITLGNHDTNSSWAQTKDGWFSYDEVYNMLYKPLEEKINTNGQLYYCLDNESQKIRYFFLNAQWVEENTNHETQLKYNEQLSWLETKCAEIGKDWSIVVVQHIFFTNYTQIKNDDGSYTTIKAERATIAGDLVSKLKEISSNELMPNVLFVMVGHTHWDWVEFFGGGFPIIATSSDSSYNWEGPGNTAWTKKKGTVEEQCFDVVHADIGKEVITSIRIGQGNDRKTHLNINNMSVGESTTLLTTLEGNVKWRSVYEDIATVDNGVINAKKAGMTTIIADNKNGEQEFWGINVS